MGNVQHAQGAQALQEALASQGLSSQLADLERRVQLQKQQIIAEHLQAQEALRWQRHLPSKPDLPSQLNPPASPITQAMELDSIHRLDNLPQVGRCHSRVSVFDSSDCILISLYV